MTVPDQQMNIYWSITFFLWGHIYNFEVGIKSAGRLQSCVAQGYGHITINHGTSDLARVQSTVIKGGHQMWAWLPRLIMDRAWWLRPPIDYWHTSYYAVGGICFKVDPFKELYILMIYDTDYFMGRVIVFVNNMLLRHV